MIKIGNVLSRFDYRTRTGLYIAVGTQVTELSAQLFGSPNTDLQQVADYKLRVNHDSLVKLLDSLSTIDAKVYIPGSTLGYFRYFKR